MSWKKQYSPELRQRKLNEREARTELLQLAELEAKQALGWKEPPKPGKGDLLRRFRTGIAREIECFDVLMGPLSEQKQILGNDPDVPVIRRFQHGASKYVPALEDRKHAEALAGGRLQFVGRRIGRILRRLVGGTGSDVQPGLSGPVAA